MESHSPTALAPLPQWPERRASGRSWVLRAGVPVSPSLSLPVWTVAGQMRPQPGPAGGAPPGESGPPAPRAARGPPPPTADAERTGGLVGVAPAPHLCPKTCQCQACCSTALTAGLGEAPPAVGRPGWRCRPAERPVARAGAPLQGERPSLRAPQSARKTGHWAPLALIP